MTGGSPPVLPAASLSRITVHLTDLPRDLAPVRARRAREWWQEDWKTRGHAHHCLPLTMANSLGYLIRSPVGFQVAWDGDWDTDVVIRGDAGVSSTVDAHSAHAAFTLQPGFIPVTHQVGDFLLVRAIPNERAAWFTVMEGLIEAWWQPAPFALVCLLNRPGRFTVARGQPVAQMCVFRAEGGFADLDVVGGPPAETAAWSERRGRAGYVKDLDYLNGRHPDGRPEPTHIRSWMRPSVRHA